MTKASQYSDSNNKLILKCSHCSKQFKYASERKRHEESHILKYDCKLCSKKFNYISSLKRHEKQHQRHDHVYCDECNHSFKDKMLLKRHKDYAHQGEPHSCNKCGAEFGSERALSTHAKSHQPETQRRFRCNHVGCKKTFNFLHHLKYHVHTHYDFKPHFCSICGKGFIQLHHLKTHLKTHDPDSWILCIEPTCKKKFANEYALKRHLKTHRNSIIIDINSKLKTKTTSLSENEKILCTFCGELISKKQLTIHSNKCVAQPQQTVPLELKVDNKYTVKEKVSSNDVQEKPNCKKSSIKIENNCKDAIGGCIVSGYNINESCLCIKMSDTQDHIPDELILKSNEEFVQKTTDTCDHCDCSSIKYDKNLYVSENIKNKSTDFNLTTSANTKSSKMCTLDEQEAIIKLDFNTVSFNSCKAVLGNCIVSGDQTIGEGCLCAKMCTDVHQSAQEIEDITPFSITEMTWSN